MHLEHFEINNIRSLKKVVWVCPEYQRSRAGWHVILGDNGSGKSTVLRSVALALVGQKNAEALRQDWSEWVPEKAETSKVEVHVKAHPDDVWAMKGKKIAKFFLGVGVVFHDYGARVTLGSVKFGNQNPERHVWSDKPGWFAASFGPFRRFTGGDKDAEKLFYSHPRLARHLSVFGEDVALTECLAWLSQLRFEDLDGNYESRMLLFEIKSFINQDGFLPHGVKLASVDSKQVRFVDGAGVHVPVNHLGDGFRSILSLTFELLRQMAQLWPNESIFEDADAGSIIVKHTGVVMIDEIDAHLHPTWQRRIGFWLTKHFPKVQFIVTTHSPLVCHAAETGTIFRLPTPGSNEEARMVTGLERDRLIFGSVLDAYGTDLFGSDVSRSESAREKQTQLAELNQKALTAKLTLKEMMERKRLQALFPASM